MTDTATTPTPATETITWHKVRAGDILRAFPDSPTVTVEWVAHDYDIANPGHLLVVFKTHLGVGLIHSDHPVAKVGHDFAMAQRQRVPFPSIQAALADTPTSQTYRLWQQAEAKWQAAAKWYRKMYGVAPTSDLLQEFYESVLTTEERAAWDLFVSGGTATPEQWAEVRANSEFTTH